MTNLLWEKKCTCIEYDRLLPYWHVQVTKLPSEFVTEQPDPTQSADDEFLNRKRRTKISNCSVRDVSRVAENRVARQHCCYEGSAASTKKELYHYFFGNIKIWDINFTVWVYICLTVTYLLFVIRVQFCGGELSFKDFFDGGGKALVFCKVLVRNFGCSEDFGFLPAWMSPNSTMATVSDVRGVYQLTLKIVAAIKKMDKIWT